MVKFYLKVKDCGEGMFSRARILKTKDYHGNTLEGFFDIGNIMNGKLKVILAKDYGKSVSVITPQYFIGQGNIIKVNKKDLTYKKHL